MRSIFLNSAYMSFKRCFCCQCLVSSFSSSHAFRPSFTILQNDCFRNVGKSFRRTLRYNVRKNEPLLPNHAQKILKVAMVGSPNAGKSTLINQIVGRNVFPVSSKVHTTRCRARAILVIEDTQLVFLDTPGVVDVQESIKHNLERVCMVDSEEAIKEADIVGVIHDVSNDFTKFKLDTKVLRYLFMYPVKPSFLILNKVDKMKSKRDLLDCVNHLTSGQGVLEEPNNIVLPNIFQLDEQCRSQLSESELRDLLRDQTGWPYFRKIFMISAVNGDGVGDVQMYLQEEAKPGKWLFKKTEITDQNDMDLIERTVFAKLLDNLPNVVPYNIRIQLDYFDRSVDGSVTAVVILFVKKAKLIHFVKGKGGRRIRNIATAVEQNLRSFYLNDVHIRLVIAQETDRSEQKSLESASVIDIVRAG